MRRFIVIVAALCALEPAQAQWAKTTLTGMHVNTFLVDGANLYAGTSVGLSVSTDGGTTWYAFKLGMTDTSIVSLAVSGGVLFVGTDTNGIYMSINGGSTWSLNSFPHRPAFTIYPAAGMLFVGSYGPPGWKLYSSTNNGATWNFVGQPPFVATVAALAFIGKNLIAGTESGLWISKDTSASWQSTGTVLNAVTSIITSGSKTYTSTSSWIGNSSPSGVFVSADSGATWKNISNGLKDTAAQCLVASGNALFVGTRSGVYLTTNGGTQWASFSTGLTDTSVYSLAVQGTYVFAATDSGVWRRPLSQVTGVALNNAVVPSRLELAQNYPNPFNPSTTMEFTVPTTGRTTLKVFDMLGREIATLVDREFKAGDIQRVRFDGTGFASGMYITRLESGGKRVARKMLLMK